MSFRLYVVGNKAVELHLPAGTVRVPGRVWYPAEGQEGLADDLLGLDQINSLRVAGTIKVRKDAERSNG